MAYSINAGLVAHWSMNEASGSALADLAGGDQVGQLQLGASIADGKIRQGIRFDGVDDVVQIPSAGVFNIVASPFSVSIWVRTLDNNATVIGRGPANGDHWALRIVNGAPQFQFMPGVRFNPSVPHKVWRMANGTISLVFEMELTQQSCLSTAPRLQLLRTLARLYLSTILNP